MKAGVREFAFVSQAIGQLQTVMYAATADTAADLGIGLTDRKVPGTPRTVLGQRRRPGN